MIRLAGPAAPPVPRLLAALALRGHEAGPTTTPDGGERTVLLGPIASAAPETDTPTAGLEGADRLLVIGWLGTHPDARDPELRRQWALEERARASGRPVLVLRLAPLLGPRSPFWLRLRTRPALPRGGRQLLSPVAESDVIETLDRALSGRAGWEGWYEVAGPEMWTLGELASLAAGCGPRLPGDAGAWEPSPGPLAAQRPGDFRPWAEHFGIEAGAPSALAPRWAA